MSKPTRWLFSEIDRWTDLKLISPDQALRIRSMYPESANRAPLGLILFSAAGAVVIGLGVILLLAYNWNDIPKIGKLALVFGSTLAAHATGLWLRWKQRPQPEIGEALSLLGTMLFGSGIWLVAQVYHIDEHFPNGFLIWGLGALALAWALESVPQAIVATLTLTAWSCAEIDFFDTPVDWAVLLVLAGIGPLAWRRRSAILSGLLLAASYFLMATHSSYWNGAGGAFTAVLALSSLLLALSRLTKAIPEAAGLRSVAAFFGWVGFVLCSYILSFENTTSHLLRWSDEHDSSMALVLHRWAPFAIAAGAWVLLLVKKLRARELAVHTEEWLCPIALVYCQGLAVAGYYGDAKFVAIIFNFVCLGIGVMWMLRGCRKGKLRTVVLGSLLFAALVLARYFDLFESLAMRGLAFLILGGVLFAEGFYYRRLRGTDAEPREHS